MRGTKERIKLYRGAWYATWTEGGKTKRVSLRTSDRAQAERNFQEYIKQGANAPQTVSDILDRWGEERTDLKSIEGAKKTFKPLKAFFGNLQPQHITRDLCREYRTKRPVKNNTVRNELAILRAAVTWFAPNQGVFELPPPGLPKDHHLTQSDYKKLLKAADKVPHMKLFIQFALNTGARSGAILDLTWDRVNFEKRLIDLNTGDHKNKRRAVVPINDALLDILKEAHNGRTSEYVIEYGGKKIESVRKSFGMTAKKAGVIASPHVLRHTAAVVMAEGGVSIDEISQFLGHSGRTTTDRVYARYSPTYLQKAASTLSKWHLRACGSK